MTNGQNVVTRFEHMQSVRDPLVHIYQDCFDLTLPIRGEGFYSLDYSSTGAAHKQRRILDNTATRSLRDQVSQLQDGLTPEQVQWFDLYLNDSTDDDKRWLSNAAKVMWESFNASNFASESMECLIDLGVAGWFVLYIFEDEFKQVQFEHWPLAQCFIASTRRDKRIDTIYRKFPLTAAQAKHEYGDEIPQNIREALNNNKFNEVFWFLQAIEPREIFAVGAKLGRNMPFASYHVELSSKKVVRESGYHEFPCAVPRWLSVPASPYAVGPTYEAFGDIGSVNEIKRLELANLDIAVGGMFVGVNDGILNPRTVRLGAKRMVMAASTDSIKPLVTGTDFRTAYISEDRIQEQIKQTFNANNLPPLDGQPRTALEISERMNIVRKLQGPIYSRSTSEYLQPAIERVFGLNFRAGKLGDPPQSLVNRNFSVRYLSPIARAQRQEESNAIKRFVANAIEVSPVFPQALDTVDIDQAQFLVGEIDGVPDAVIRKGKKLIEHRQRLAQAQAEAQNRAAAEEVLVEGGKKRIAQA